MILLQRRRALLATFDRPSCKAAAGRALSCTRRPYTGRTSSAPITSHMELPL